MKRSLSKPPPPKTAMAASSARTNDVVQHRREERYDHPSPEPASGPAGAASETAMAPELWPLTITWPAGSSVAVIGGQWRRLPDGRIEAVYHSLPELRSSITLTQYAREWSAPMEQAVMFAAPVQGNYEEK